MYFSYKLWTVMDYFLITKPLQFMVCSALSERLNLRGVLLIVDSFYGAKEFSEKSELLKYFSDVVFFDTIQKAFVFLIRSKGISQVYLDSDYGVQKNLLFLFIKLLNSKAQINVYEEGNGVYRNDLVEGRLKKLIYSFLPLSPSLGGSPFTKKIYVVDKDRYNALRPELSDKAIDIDIDFTNWINKNIEKLISLFGGWEEIESPLGRKCILYVTNWEVDTTVVDYLSNQGECFFVKPHPHIKKLDINESINVINSGLPVEVVLIKLLDTFDTVDVYHSGTSALDYVDNSRINSFDIRRL